MTSNILPGHVTGRNILLWFLRWGMRRLLHFKITGVENIPAGGPVIIIMNHIAFLDPLMVCGASPRHLIPLAKKEAFDSRFMGPIMKIHGAIPLQRGEMDIQAIKWALHILKNKGVILLAPEGTRSPTYQLQSGKEGAILLALRSGATIVPIGITGTHQVKSYWKKLQRAPVQLTVGKPFRLRPASTNGRTRRAELADMTQETMYRLAAQLPEEFRGVYADLETATEGYLIPVQK